MRTITETLLDFYSCDTYAEETMGSVDELGYFALINAPTESQQRMDLRDELFYTDVYSILPHELLAENWWYIVSTNSQGLIDYIVFPRKEDALKLWKSIEKSYAEWQDSNE